MIESSESLSKKNTLLDFFRSKPNTAQSTDKAPVVYDLTSDNDDDLEVLSAANPIHSINNGGKMPFTSISPKPMTSPLKKPKSEHSFTSGSTIVLSDDDEPSCTFNTAVKKRPPFRPTLDNQKRPAYGMLSSTHPSPATNNTMSTISLNPTSARPLPGTFMKASALLPTQPNQSPYFYQKLKGATQSPKKASASSQSKSATSSQSSSTTSYEPNLSDEQRRVLDLAVKDGQSVFFTGSAGTGKSVLMRAMISALKKKYGGNVAVTASTGIAACNINGCTLHSFAGIGLGQEPVEKLIEMITNRKQTKDRWKKTKVLIIDEISMVDATLFDKLEKIAQRFCRPGLPFGGIQVIVTGDFFQLPPVKSTGFAFEAKSWSNVMKKTVILTHVFRQKDQLFVDVLNEMRLGNLSDTAIQLFTSLNRPLPESQIVPAELYPLRWQVEKSNNTRLDALNGSIHEFQAYDSGRDPKKMESCIAPSVIRLKKDAQVMLLKNMDTNLVNGSLGIVVGFAGDEVYDSTAMLRSRVAPNRRGEGPTEADFEDMLAQGYPIVRFANDREIVVENDRWSQTLPDGTELASRSQVPLILAWAMSIHKSQGQTLERVKVDLGQSFEDGMAYVALSRATSMDSLQIVNFKPSKVTASKKVATFYRSLEVV